MIQAKHLSFLKNISTQNAVYRHHKSFPIANTQHIASAGGLVRLFNFKSANILTIFLSLLINDYKGISAYQRADV